MYQWVACYAAEANGPIPRCGAFGGTCTSNLQCVTNSCQNGECMGPVSSCLSGCIMFLGLHVHEWRAMLVGLVIGEETDELVFYLQLMICSDASLR